MLLKVKSLKLLAGRPVAILHHHTAQLLNLHVNDRVRIRVGKKPGIVSVIDTAKGLSETEIVLSEEIIRELKLKEGKLVEITPEFRPTSVTYIREKLKKGRPLSYAHLLAVMSDIVSNRLSEPEIAYFVAASQIRGMIDSEVVALTRAMVKTGKKLGLRAKYILDKHGIGGLAGNRTTPLVAAIIAAAIDQLRLPAIFPKTSSRAITSPAGTADVMECFCSVELTIEQIKEVVRRCSACLAWGGALGLAPADDKIIQVERLLALDPESQLLASILAKKLAVGASHCLIDLPYGSEVKVKTRAEAARLAKKFVSLGSALKVKIDYMLSDGSEPLGNGFGPLLEARDLLQVLEQHPKRPVKLEQKALLITSKLLGMIKVKNSAALVKQILHSGKALQKFSQIIQAQQGSLAKLRNLKHAKYSLTLKSKKAGKVKKISNKAIMILARAAGCPADKAAGIFLHKHVGDIVKTNDKLLTIYAKSRERLNNATKLLPELKTFSIR